MEVLQLAIIVISNIVCFLIGWKAGRKANRGEDIAVPTIPTINPLKAYREKEAQKEALAETVWRNAILRNIENYDGTSAGQVDVPEKR